MIKNETFTLENINRIHNEFNIDPELIQRAIFALGLVEALRKAGATFVFKGGSSLMLLFDVPQRLSTDVDIVVNRDYDIDYYIEKASKIFPFVSAEESIRKTTKKISKKHYKFSYLSPIRNKNLTVILDVLFSDNYYVSTVDKPIKNVFLLTEGSDYYVSIPTLESLLGDKLTAFAPHTIGINYYNDDFSNDKRLEVIKQFFDVVSLFEIANNFEEIRNSYYKNAKEEITYKGLDISPEDCLMDSFNTALSLLSWGKFYKNDYQNLINGISKIKNHIIGKSFTTKDTAIYSAKIMLLSACVLKNINPFKMKIDNSKIMNEYPYNKINFILKIGEQKAYDIAVKAIEIINNG